MKIPELHDDLALDSLLLLQKKKAWDLDKDLPWKRGVDLSKFLVPIDRHGIVFQKLEDPHLRRTVSQYMGLLIASTFSEMEMALDRLKPEAWGHLCRNCDTKPELKNLAEEFFIEEAKHARAFERYLDKFAQAVNCEPFELKGILPQVRPGMIEKVLRLNAAQDGTVAWWVIATVEEHSMLIFKQMKPFQKQIDPLYFALHQKHFEEEARHSPLAFMLLEDLNKSPQNLTTYLRRHTDFFRSEVLKITWMLLELSKIHRVSRLVERHEFFSDLHSLWKKTSIKDLLFASKRFLFETPYISPFLNYRYHHQITKDIGKSLHLRMPLPEPAPLEVTC